MKNQIEIPSYYMYTDRKRKHYYAFVNRSKILHVLDGPGYGLINILALAPKDVSYIKKLKGFVPIKKSEFMKVYKIVKSKLTITSLARFL